MKQYHSFHKNLYVKKGKGKIHNFTGFHNIQRSIYHQFLKCVTGRYLSAGIKTMIDCHLFIDSHLISNVSNIAFENTLVEKTAFFFKYVDLLQTRLLEVLLERLC